MPPFEIFLHHAHMDAYHEGKKLPSKLRIRFRYAKLWVKMKICRHTFAISDDGNPENGPAPHAYVYCIKCGKVDE